MEEIAEVENPEIERLYKGLDERLSDAFIAISTLQGIKRYEAMLGIKPYPGAAIEERRIEVFRRWHLALPYTLKKLLEELNAIVGSSGYELQTRFEQYEMELHVYDQSLRILYSVRQMVQDMIPANLLLFFVGEMRNHYTVPVLTESRLTFISSFYPRHNIPPFFLNGEAELNGEYLLNGYMDNWNLDFYPINVKLNGYFKQDMRLFGHLCLPSHAQLFMRSALLPSIQGITEVEGRLENILQMSADAGQQMSADGLLVVEKDLWYLDGNQELNGEVCLDADIYEVRL